MPPSQLQKKLIRPGNGQDFPRTGDQVTIEYTGWLYDASKASNDYKGRQYVTISPEQKCQSRCSDLGASRFDSSKGRGDFRTPIGVGRVIPGGFIWSSQVQLSCLTARGEGWDQAVPQMSLGEKCILTIPG